MINPVDYIHYSPHHRGDGFQTTIDALQRQRNQALNHTGSKPQVVISGAGPAGLMRGIQALLQGSPTVILEKRGEHARHRDNVVALETETLNFLKDYGVYQYLIENHLIFKPNKRYASVKIADLEMALKKVVEELTKNENPPVIQYDSEISSIGMDNVKVELTVENKDGSKTKIHDIDIFINAEGMNSTTNKILGFNRISVLPKIPVIVAIFKDDRPEVKDVSSLTKYMGKTLVQKTVADYYRSLFIFKLIFQKQSPFNDKRAIAGSLILKTPKQNYLGIALSKKETDKLLALNQKVEDIRKNLETTANDDETKQLTRALKKAEQTKKKYLKKTIGCSFYFANLINLAECMLDKGKTPLNQGSWLPLDYKQTNITEIGADYIAESSGLIGDTICLTVGDAFATVDPSTGLGCNTALNTSWQFEQLLKKFRETDLSVDDILNVYHSFFEAKRQDIHLQSKIQRLYYRPDAFAVERKT